MKNAWALALMAVCAGCGPTDTASDLFVKTQDKQKESEILALIGHADRATASSDESGEKVLCWDRGNKTLQVTFRQLRTEYNVCDRRVVDR